MPNVGAAQAVLLNQAAVFGASAPMKKITPTGGLRAVLSNTTPKIISQNVDNGTGYIRDVKIRGKKRMPGGKTSTEDACLINSEPAYFEQSIPELAIRSYGMFFEWSFMEALTENALAIASGGNPSVDLAMEMWDSIANCVNGILYDVNGDILTALYSNRGVNKVYASNAAQTCNFPLSGANNNLAQGVTMLMNDMLENETNWSTAKVIGNGLSNAYWMQHLVGAKGLNAAGLDTSALTNPDYFFDPQAASKWATNRFCIMGEDAVGLISQCLFRGRAKSGQKGDSEFGTILLPALTQSDGTVVRELEMDFQVRHITCPQDLTIQEAEAYPDAVAKGRGSIINLIFRFAPVFQSASSYESTDPLYQNNEVYFYNATNA